MKIVHVAPVAPYNEYWGYQENILPKYQRMLGHDVTLIITNTMHQNGKIVETECNDFVLNDGVRVIRRAKKKYVSSKITNINSKLEIFDLLTELKPDFIFAHGLISTTIFDVIRYKKKINPDCKIVQDNHLDRFIGPPMDSFKRRLYFTYYKWINKRSIRFVERVYGVTPWRKEYAETYFGIPASKTDVLIMGADDEKINFENRKEIRKRIRETYNVSDDDFLIVTGGKIDKNKNIHLLMKACSNLERVKLLVFGNVLDDLKEEFDNILRTSENITHIGWIDSSDVYDYFLSADIVCFPGAHSVLWEQACASKVPCLFERWDGMEHVNNGGNSDFVYPISEKTLKDKISELLFTEKYYEMKRVAESAATDIYLYSNIAKKSLECAQAK